MEPGDGRAKYPMFQGEEWRRNQDFLDRRRELSARIGRSVAQIAVNWVLCQPGITVALCGAKRPGQIRETALVMQWRLTERDLPLIENALRERGLPVVRMAV